MGAFALLRMAVGGVPNDYHSDPPAMNLKSYCSHLAHQTAPPSSFVRATRSLPEVIACVLFHDFSSP